MPIPAGVQVGFQDQAIAVFQRLDALGDVLDIEAQQVVVGIEVIGAEGIADEYPVVLFGSRYLAVAAQVVAQAFDDLIAGRVASAEECAQ